MARHDGAASWLFLPYVSCGQVIPRHRLQALEQKTIGLYPNSLNRVRHPSSLYEAVPKYDCGFDKRCAHCTTKAVWQFPSGDASADVRCRIVDGAVLSGNLKVM